MNAIQVFSYNGSNVTFSNENGMWVNATEMAKPFGKKPIDWLRHQSTNEFLETLFKVRNTEGKVSPTHFENQNYYGFVVTERGGANPCSWFHEDVAIEFARWLAPAFAIWCNDRIKEILKGGSNIPTTADEIIAYGYGKALEKINRQSTIIARQSKQLQKYKAQLESEIAARKMKRLAATQEMRDERISLISDWLNICNLVGVVSLAKMKVDFYEYCKGKDMTISVASSIMGKILKSMGLESLRSRDGSYYILKNQL